MNARMLWLAVPLGLAACHSYAPPPSPPGTVARGCEDTADADPRLKNFARTNYDSSGASDFTADYYAYRRTLIKDCIAVRGGKPLGGVEKPIR
jgi:hypothetical protein